VLAARSCLRAGGAGGAVSGGGPAFAADIPTSSPPPHPPPPRGRPASPGQDAPRFGNSPAGCGGPHSAIAPIPSKVISTACEEKPSTHRGLMPRPTDAGAERRPGTGREVECTDPAYDRVSEVLLRQSHR